MSSAKPSPPGDSADSTPTLLGMFLSLMVLIAAGYIAFKVFRSGETPGTTHPAVGKPLPSFAAPSLADPPGEPATLEGLRGQVALIDYWGPWCPPCRQELPHLVALAQARKGKPFRLVLVSCSSRPDDDQTELAVQSREMLAALGTRQPVYGDPDLSNRRSLVKAASLDGFGYPTTVLLDQEGVLRGLWIGYLDGQETEIAEAIDRLLP